MVSRKTITVIGLNRKTYMTVKERVNAVWLERDDRRDVKVDQFSFVVSEGVSKWVSTSSLECYLADCCASKKNKFHRY